jgi:hypothetical protein
MANVGAESHCWHLILIFIYCLLLKPADLIILFKYDDILFSFLFTVVV